MQQGSSDRAAPVSQRLQWDDVRYFLALARLGSLSAASRSLDVEHSTVARRVEALERALGLRLFDRLPRGWTLTTEGEALVVQAKGLEDQAIAFSRAALGVASLAGTVRISAPPMTASHFLAPRLATLREAWPDIDLELIGESRDADLAHGEAELALRLARPTAAGLAARALGRMGSGLYASPAHAVRPPQEWVFLGYDRSLGQVAQHTWLEGIADGRRFVLRSNDLAVLYQACRAGLGIALLPHFLARSDAALVAVPCDNAPPPRSLWLVVHPDVRRSPRVRAVADSLAEIIAAAAAVLDPQGPGS
ncbi:MAG: LysR family transcriptional regulator [Rhodocyclaceae bacterium]|nr:LysR family transcriptional regulator [Rhodocyclaceae bacterium]